MQIGLKTEPSQLGQVKFKPARNLSWTKLPSTYLGSKSINLYLLQILQKTITKLSPSWGLVEAGHPFKL